MSAPLDALRDSLVRQHGLGLRGGLPASAADELVRALSEGADLGEVAGPIGLDGRLAASVTRSGVADAPAVLSRLMDTLSSIESGSRILRSAGLYPLVLAGSVLLAGVVAGGVGVPALRAIPGQTAGVGVGLAVAVGVATGLLVLLSMAVLARVRLPLLSAGWTTSEGYAVADCLAVLTGAGAPLPEALRASAAWARGPERAAAEAFARDLEAGRAPVAAGPLFDPFESGLLAAAAENGTVVDTASALAEHRRIRMDRTLPLAVLRIQVTALAVAGLALLAVASAFYWEYSRVFAG